MTRRNEATERQVQAALPTASTWLAANAGSGKTRVLTDRVARLLLQDVPPEKVLCLTYTKAAASEMQNRLFKRLGEWAMMPDVALAEQLADLGEQDTLTAARLSSARTLFARAIETPGGLKIQTIHSFCASLLRRFPLEAGVSPQFAEMEDRAAAMMRAEIVEDLADGPHAGCVRDLATYLSDPDFEQITAQIAAHRAGFAEPLSRAQIADKLDLPKDADFAMVLAQAIPPGTDGLVEASLPALRAQSKTMVALADGLAAIDWALPGRDSYDALCKLFLLGSGSKPEAKTKTVPTKKAREAMGALAEEFQDWMEQVAEAKALELRLIAVDKSTALHQFAAAFLPEYARRKAIAGALDFDDLVLKSRDLLRDPSVAEWVLYRLDGGIDHILVDEAQDTSPAQWDVVDRLAQEFTAGEGARDGDRTIFVVGDKKQSIYSFQGADPDGFDRMQTAFAERLAAMGRHLQDLVLEFSFRSSSAVLSLVDAVFDGQDNAGFGAEGRHRAFKDTLPGRVDLWAPVKAVK